MLTEQQKTALSAEQNENCFDCGQPMTGEEHRWLEVDSVPGRRILCRACETVLEPSSTILSRRRERKAKSLLCVNAEDRCRGRMEGSASFQAALPRRQNP